MLRFLRYIFVIIVIVLFLLSCGYLCKIWTIVLFLLSFCYLFYCCYLVQITVMRVSFMYKRLMVTVDTVVYLCT